MSDSSYEPDPELGLALRTEELFATAAGGLSLGAAIIPFALAGFLIVNPGFAHRNNPVLIYAITVSPGLAIWLASTGLCYGNSTGRFFGRVTLMLAAASVAIGICIEPLFTLLIA